MKRMRGPLLVIGVVIALVWILPVLLPEDSGWLLGPPFRIFYTAIALLGLLFYLLLEAPAPAGTGAEEYIRQSILDPAAFVVEGFDPIMPPGLLKVVGENNFDDLVAYLMSLE
jgi:hypothetical protein